MDVEPLAMMFYLRRVPEDALVRLQKLAHRQFDKAPRFCAWLDDVLHAELLARLQDDGCELPTQEFYAWGNAEIGAAVVVAHQLAFVTLDPISHEFLEQLEWHLLLTAQARLNIVDDPHFAKPLDLQGDC